MDKETARNALSLAKAIQTEVNSILAPKPEQTATLPHLDLQDWPSSWPVPDFKLGEMVWLRSEPREPHRIAGVDQIDGWTDGDGEWVEPSWLYRLDHNFGDWFASDVLVDREAQPEVLQDFIQREATKAATNDYDPFRDTDDLP